MSAMIASRTRRIFSTVSLSLAFALTACAPKDADIKADVDKAIAGVSGVTVEVANGVATMSGTFADDAARASTEATVKAVKGVKSVVDNATVTPPPPPPVVMSPDDSLESLAMTLLKDYPMLMAEVEDSVITLTGEIKKSELTNAMQALSTLNPKKIENKAKVIK